MARFSNRSFSFANGEASPFLAERADMEFYFTAYASGINMIPDQFGNLHRRAGTRHVSRASAEPTFYRFDAANDEPLIIVATEFQFKFLLDGADIGVTVVTSYTAEQSAELKYVEDLGAIFFFHPDHPVQKLVRTSSGFTLSPLVASPLGPINADEALELQLGAGGSAGGTVTMRTRVVTAGQVVGLTTDGGITVKNVTVSAYNGAGVSTVAGLNLVAGSYTVWANGAEDGTVTLSLNRATLTARGGTPFRADMVGQQISVLDEAGSDATDGNDPNTWITVTVLGLVSTTQLSVEYSGLEIAYTDFFQLPQFYDGKYPSFGWIDQDRIWLGDENIICGSAASDFFDWRGFDADGTVNADNAIYLTIGAGKAADIQWLQTVGRQILVGTSNSVHSIYGSGVGGGFQADGTGQQLVDDAGASSVRPVMASGAVIFVDAVRSRIFLAGAGAQYDQISLSDQNMFADHIGKRSIKKMAFQRVPFPLVWVVTDDGGLFTMTFWPEQSVRGWSSHVLGGSLKSGVCLVDPQVLDVEVQKSSDGLSDVVVFAVKRTINGVDVVDIERLGKFFDHDSKQQEAHYLDAALPLNETGVAVLPLAASVSGTAPTVALPLAASGRVALSDGVRWFYGDADASAGSVAMDFPNTSKPTYGRTLRLDGDAWVTVPRAAYGAKPQHIGAAECLYDPPEAVTAIAYGVTAIGGLSHLEGQEVVVYMDAQDHGAHVVTGGAVTASGCVGWVGLPYVSQIDLLPYRVSLGSTDGANDPSKVIRVSFNLYRSPFLEIGTDAPNEFMGWGDSFAQVDVPENFETAHAGFHTGWVSGVPMVGVGNNDTLGLSFRVRGPWPAIIRGMEATIYASGGK